MNYLDEEDRIKEIYAYFGLAIYNSQCLERTLSMGLVTVFNLDINTLTREKFDSDLERNFKKTLGSLLRELEKTQCIEEELKIELSQILDKRNWLAHHYFWDRVVQIMYEEGQLNMIKELKEISDHFLEMDSKLMELLQEWRRMKGIADEDVQKNLDELILQIPKNNQGK